MMSTSDYMVESTAYPLHLDPHHRSAHSPIYTENPQAFYMRHHHTENDVMEMSTLRHRNTQRFHFPYGTTDYLQHHHAASASQKRESVVVPKVYRNDLDISSLGTGVM
ncbi:hypothetical protein AVEN_170997-1 [Araneus ventricosus]|uniref:Uncharacterized protein n=1 Tax=Araneus ventricosus TaxID=182803 RepID=A0A4Y2GHK2_ARAVE|nr:hypothetical protein AVEN_170997-1 [Araneus ventricosus]